MSSCSLEMKLYPRIDRIWLIAMMQSDRVIEDPKSVVGQCGTP